jgi:hypothetical protein
MSILLIFLISTLVVFIKAKDNKFSTHDRVAAVANTVGPFNNPTETYHVRFKVKYSS